MNIIISFGVLRFDIERATLNISIEYNIINNESKTLSLEDFRVKLIKKVPCQPLFGN